MKYKLIVFDWDGTVIDSPAAIVECMQAASRELSLAVPEPERASHVIGLGLHDAMKIVAPDLPASAIRSTSLRTAAISSSASGFGISSDSLEPEKPVKLASNSTGIENTRRHTVRSSGALRMTCTQAGFHRQPVAPDRTW